MLNDQRFEQVKKITLIAAGITALLGIVKLVGGIIFHSHALVADAIHSFSDLFTDGLVILASHFGSQDADSTHPYGHKRFETAATMLLALILILAGVGIAWDSLNEIIHKNHTMPGILTVPIAILSILGNEAIFQITRKVGKQIQSDLLIANAWHHRSDAASSAVVLIGLIGSILGFLWFDVLAAAIVGCLIIQMGLSYGWNSIKELVDTAVEPQMLEQIEQIIDGVNGVQKIHQLRTRMMGGDIFVDVHILVAPNITVSEGHYIAQHVHRSLVAQLERVKDVTVHVDPEDDEISSPSFHLPTRQLLEKELLQSWYLDYPEIQLSGLHYLNGTLSIDLMFDQTFDKISALQQRIDHDLIKYPNITTVRLLSHKATLVILRSRNT